MLYDNMNVLVKHKFANKIKIELKKKTSFIFFFFKALMQNLLFSKQIHMYISISEF